MTKTEILIILFLALLFTLVNLYFYKYGHQFSFVGYAHDNGLSFPGSLIAKFFLKNSDFSCFEYGSLGEICP